MSDDVRGQLAERQARLLDALAGRADAPAGFDADRVDLAGRTLLSKRRKTAAKAWPVLAASLSDRFPGLFDEFARSFAPPPDGPAADGLNFARWLDGRGEFPRQAAAELLAATLWRGGRRINAAVRLGDGRLLIGIRVPLLGVRLLAVPAPRRGGVRVADFSR